MKDNFQWTPELLAEFFNTHPDLPPTLMNEINLFKSSKAPKKEWEVVAYHFKPLRNGDKLVLVNPGSGYWTEAKSGNPDYGIHAVCRLSDQALFEVHELVDTPSDGKQTIYGFELERGDMLVKMRGGYIGLSAIQKLPAPLFVTTDGVEIYPGMEFLVVRDYACLAGGRADKNDKIFEKEGITFSTREAAEHYILQNRPLLSLNDVKEALDSSFCGETALEKLTALVKQKLNS